MTRLTESSIEDLAIDLLEAEGCRNFHGSTIAPDGVASERDSYEDVLLLGRVEAAVARLNSAIPATSLYLLTISHPSFSFLVAYRLAAALLPVKICLHFPRHKAHNAAGSPRNGFDQLS